MGQEFQLEAMALLRCGLTPPAALCAATQDDLCFADTVSNGWAAAAYTTNITALAREGIALSHNCEWPRAPCCPAASPADPCW